MKKKFDLAKIKKVSDFYYKEVPVIKSFKSENNYVFLLKFKNFEKVIKLCSPNDSWKVEKEIYLFELLSDNHVPVPKVDYSETEGLIGESWYIMDNLGDENLNDLFKRSEEKSKYLFFELGQLFARIHKIKFDFQGQIYGRDIEKQSFSDSYRNSFEKSSKLLFSKGKISEKELINAKNIFSNFVDSNQRSLCHDDFGPWQAIIKDGKISGIIDWEWARVSNPVYDFSKSELLIDLWSGNFDEFQRGYESVTNLPKDYNKIKLPYQIVELMNMMVYFLDNSKNFNLAKNKFLKLIS